MRAVRRGVCLAIALAVPAVLGTVSAAASTSAAGAWEPALVVVPPEPFGSRDELYIEVHVADPEGVDRVAVMVRGEHDAGFRSVMMEPKGEGVFGAHLEEWRERGETVHYYLQAFDAAGHPVTRNGEALNPFVARARQAQGAPPLATATGTWKHPIWIAIGLLVLTGIAGSWLRSRLYREPEEAPGVRPQPQRTVAAPYLQAALDRIEEDIFWYRRLSPLADLPDEEVEPLLAALAEQTHDHPTKGECRFDLRTIRQRLLWLRKVDRRELLARRNSLRLQAGQSPASPIQRHGFVLIEVLVTVALIALIMAAAWFSIRRVETPLYTGGEMVHGMLERARAGALSTLSVRRVRPFNNESLVLESATSCTSGTWSLEDDKRTALPHGVSLTDTAWSICFNSRGISSENRVITLTHRKYGTQGLEVLRGGAVRWQ